uniref:CRAL-TRIO domain-containing protein n=1 Tax=Kalanchoe fedtschenkoi TaxID=63787 RepID=A0A7N0ZX70_KALFE
MLQNSTSIDDQMKLVVYTFENATFGLPEGLEHLVWLIDFTGWSLFNVPLKASRDFLSTMQNHYPERLAMCFLYDPPASSTPPSRLRSTSWMQKRSRRSNLCTRKMKRVLSS